MCDSVQLYLVSDKHATLTLGFGGIFQLPSHPLTPSRHAEGKAMTVAPTYHTLPHPSSHGTSLSSTMMWGPLEPPNTPKPWSLSCLRPAPPLRPSAALCYKEVRRDGNAWSHSVQDLITSSTCVFRTSVRVQRV